jgi:hypothetical protein
MNYTIAFFPTRESDKAAERRQVRINGQLPDIITIGEKVYRYRDNQGVNADYFLCGDTNLTLPRSS